MKRFRFRALPGDVLWVPGRAHGRSSSEGHTPWRQVRVKVERCKMRVDAEDMRNISYTFRILEPEESADWTTGINGTPQQVHERMFWSEELCAKYCEYLNAKAELGRPIPMHRPEFIHISKRKHHAKIERKVSEVRAENEMLRMEMNDAATGNARAAREAMGLSDMLRRVRIALGLCGTFMVSSDERMDDILAEIERLKKLAAEKDGSAE
jgi:hypothetical protein